MQKTTIIFQVLVVVRHKISAGFLPADRKQSPSHTLGSVEKISASINSQNDLMWG